MGVYGFAAGYKLNENLRFDLSLDYRGSYKVKNSLTGDASNKDLGLLGKEKYTASNKVKSYAAMFNVYYDIGQFNKFTPYLGAGLGVARNQTGETNFVEDKKDGKTVSTIAKGTKTNFAYKLVAGTSYAIDSNVDINLQYQYVNLGKFTTGTQVTIGAAKATPCKALTGNIKAHEILVGLTYKF